METQPPRGSLDEPGRNLVDGKQGPDRGAGFDHLGQVGRIALTTSAATFSVVVSPRMRFDSAPRSAIRWYIPSPAMKPGQITEKPTGARGYSARSDSVSPISPAFVAA